MKDGLFTQNPEYHAGKMKEYRVVVASYSVELVEAESPEDACEIAMEIFEPTDEWVIAEVDEIEPLNQGETA